jgi:uncharacterized protein YdaU (DUF1376 family)
MAKQPYIPLYIGDWEQDVNGLSIEAEGAWLKIIFKCWRNEGTFTATIEILARVCKVTPEKFASILLEWELGNICEITRQDGGLITLANRRILRDREISKERQIAGAKGGAKAKQKPSKPEAKPKQIPEYDNDIVIDNESDIELKLKESINEIYIDQEKRKWPHLDFAFEVETFKNKVRGSPQEYRGRDSGGIRLAFQYQLRTSKGKPKNGKQTTTNRNNEHIAGLADHFTKTYGSTLAGGKDGSGIATDAHQD